MIILFQWVGCLNPTWFYIFSGWPRFKEEDTLDAHACHRWKAMMSTQSAPNLCILLLRLFSRQILWIFSTDLPGYLALKNGGDFWWTFSGFPRKTKHAKCSKTSGENSSENPTVQTNLEIFLSATFLSSAKPCKPWTMVWVSSCEIRSTGVGVDKWALKGTLWPMDSCTLPRFLKM